MKTKNLWKHISIIIVALSLFVAVGTVLGQEPEPPLSGPEEEEGTGIEGEASIMAYPARTMNYQGYLTDGSGNPLDGDYDMVFSLWSLSTGGSKRWGNETHNDVPVSNGLFSVALGETEPLDPYNDFDEQLYLEIAVDGATLPRQMLRAVPYAMGLTAGAQVRGSTELDEYGLRVLNNGGRGIYADGYGDGIYSLFSADITYSNEGYAGPDTYVWLPLLDAVIEYDDQSKAHLEPAHYGEMVIEADAAGSNDVDILIPIQIERPYGRDYLVRWARVYYRVDSAAYIDYTYIEGRSFTTAYPRNIGSNTTNQISEAFDFFDVKATSYYTVTMNAAPTNMNIRVHMNSSAGTVWLYGVRLQLGSTY